MNVVVVKMFFLMSVKTKNQKIILEFVQGVKNVIKNYVSIKKLEI